MRNRIPMMAGTIALVGLFDGPFASQGVVRGSADLVGEWKGETYAGGSTALVTLNLFPNGTYSRRVVASSEFGWTLEGNVLLLAPALIAADREVSYGKASAVQVRLDGDLLVATAGNESITLRRVTWPVKETPILGRWEGQSDLNEGITQDFTADGRLIVNVTLSREAGRYSIGDGSITWMEQIPRPGRKRSKYRIEDGKLILYIAPKLPPIELTRTAPDSTAS